jgi:hypothetical protein
MYQESPVAKSIKNALVNYPEAQEALNKLVGKGVDPEMLMVMLIGYVFSGYLSTAPLWLPLGRTRRKLQSDIEDLAASIENLFLYPGISAGLCDLALSDDILLDSASVTGLPNILRNSGRFIGALPSRPSQKRGSRYKRVLCYLVDYIKFVTGKPHYALVVVLLNAVDSVGADFEVTRSGLRLIESRKKKCEGPRWDSVVLGQLIYREKAGEHRQTPSKIVRPI